MSGNDRHCSSPCTLEGLQTTPGPWSESSRATDVERQPGRLSRDTPGVAEGGWHGPTQPATRLDDDGSDDDSRLSLHCLVSHLASDGYLRILLVRYLGLHCLPLSAD